MRVHSSPNAGRTTATGLQKVYEGGFGVAGAPGIRLALNAVPYSAVNQASGVAGLDSLNKYISSRLYLDAIGTISLDGPSKVVKSTTSEYLITNYDSFTDYTLSVTSGTISRVNEKLFYTATNVTGAVTLTVNGKTYPLTVVDFKPNTPTITGTHTAGPSNTTIGNFYGSAFVLVGTTDTHISTDWQVATDAAFANVVISSLEDLTNLVSWTTNQLARSTTYFIRCRYRTQSGLISDWSNSLNFTTRAVYYPSLEQAKLVASDRVASDYFGTAVSISDDGNRVAIGAYGCDVGTSNTGAVYVFLKNGSSWAQEAKLVASDRANGDQLGWTVSLDGTGTRLIAGAPLDNNNSLTDNGAAYIFIRNGTTWTQEAILVAPAATRSSSARFAQAADIDSTGTRVVIGAYNADQSGANNCGMAYIFTRSGTSWSIEATLIASDRLQDDNGGYDVAIDSTGTRICFGAYNDDNASATNTGSVYVFTRNVTSWSQEAKLLATDRLSGDCLGYAVDMDSAGTRIVAGAYNDDDSGLTNSGAVYIFLRSGSTWSQEAKLLASDKISSAWFGSAVSIDSSGLRVLIGAFSMTINGNAGAGQAYTFTREGTTWTQDGTIRPFDLAANDNFAFDLDIDPSGNTIIVGASYADVSSVSNTGASYIFTS